MKSISIALIALGTFGAATVGYSQSMFSPSGPPDVSSKMSPLFGERAFSASVATVVEKGTSRVMSMKSKQAVAEGSVRNEINMSDVSGGGMSPQAASQMKEMGLDQTVTIYNAKNNSTIMLYPGLKSYLVLDAGTPTTSEDAGSVKIEKTEITKEEVAGHPTVKSKVTVTKGDGTTHDFIVWEATDMGNFPVQTQIQAEGTTTTCTYSDVKQGTVDPASFKAPEEFKKFDSMQQLMMSAMESQMPAMGK